MRKLSVLLVALVVSTPAYALSNRCFVKSTGVDTGTCAIASPCRSFAYAMTQVASFGEVIALDTAGYGTLTISQAVNVFAPNGITAFIAVSSGTGIVVNATSDDSVVLRGLALSANGGFTDIDFMGGYSLAIENCIINGFASVGVQMTRTADISLPRIRIENTTIRLNSVGVYTSNVGSAPPQGGPPPGTAGLTIANSSISENTNGISAADNTRAAVTDTVISGNNYGIIANTSASLSSPEVTAQRCTIALSTGAGVFAGNTGLIRIANNLITANFVGVYELSGTVSSISGGTNAIEGNGTDGTPSGSYTGK